MTGELLAAAAAQLVGAPFRLHGRDPATGLDCIGVLAAALSTCCNSVHLPRGYTLRTRVLPDLGVYVSGCGLVTATGTVVAGDVLLVRAGPGQFHLLIATGSEEFIHAHAGLKRVIRGALVPDWPVVRHWRLAAAIKD
jgi:hypothetical protein